MAFDAHSNAAYSLVATAPSPATSGTSLVVTAGEGARFAAPCNVTIWALGAQPLWTSGSASGGDFEIARVTNVSGDTLTIVRAQEGTSARTIVVGDQIANTITAKVLTDIETVVWPTSNLGSGADGSGAHFLADDQTYKTIDTSALAGGAVVQYIARQYFK